MLEVLIAAVVLLYALSWLMQKEASSFTLNQRLPWDQCVYELFSHHGKLVGRITTAMLPKDMAGFSIAYSGKYSLTLSRRLTTEERKFFSAVTLAKLMDEQADDSHIIAVDRKLTLNEVRRAEALLAELSLCPTTRTTIPPNNILSHLVSPIAQIRRNVSWIGIQVKKVRCASFANWSAEARLKRPPWTTVSSTLTAISADIVIMAALALVGLVGLMVIDDRPISGEARAKCIDAVLTEHPDGRVTETKVGDDGAAYEVEIRREDGSQVETHLNGNCQVIGQEADDDGWELVIHQEVGDHAPEDTTLDNVEGVYRELGQYDQALENYQLRGHDGQWESSVAFRSASHYIFIS
jgi:hypothetical protein